jgi:hypothetical protein
MLGLTYAEYGNRMFLLYTYISYAPTNYSNYINKI